MASSAEPPIGTRRFKRVEYERLAELQFFGADERLELLDGLLVVREPQGSRHATAVRLAAAALRTAFGAGWIIEAQLPIALDEVSEPEPDVSVVRGRARDYRDAHPARPVLVVEVADASPEPRRTFKLALYARAGIADCWVVNLVDRVVEVYRDPICESPHGWRYATVMIARPPDAVRPLAAPDARVAVADLLP
jgi:Uma2 family endonuclease